MQKPSKKPGQTNLGIDGLVGAVTRRSRSFSSGAFEFENLEGGPLPRGRVPSDWGRAAIVESLEGRLYLANLAAPILTAPSNGSTGQSTTPTLNWSSVSGASSYRIMIATNPSDLPTDPTAGTGGASVVFNDTPTGTSDVPSLQAGTTYYWEVHGRSNSQFGTWSSIFSFTTAPVITNLAAPILTAPSNGSTGQSTTPTLNWSSVSGASSYRIMIATNPSDLPTDPTAGTGGASVVFNDTPTGTSDVPSLQAGTTYYWEVHGRSNSQFGTWSSIFSFTTATVVTPPVAPNNLQSTAISSTRIDIAWQDRASNESGFHIWSWDGSQLLLIASVSAGTQSFSQTGLSPSTTYSYYVSAFNGAGDTFTSSFTSATTLSATITEPAGLLWTPSPNFDRRPSGQIIDSIVIHTTEGSYDSTISEFQNSHPENPNLQRSAHYVIKPNGEITQMIALANRAYHATYYNSRSIGIEMVGAASQQSTWNTQNMDALATLVAYLVTRFPTIPVVHPLGDATGTSNCRFNEVGLVAHSQIQPVAQCISGQGLNQKTDPGVYFQWNAFADSVNAKLGLPIVTISATAPNASENGPTAGTFKISRGSSTAGILVVQYSVGGTASSGDYQSISNTATILDGQSSVTVTVRPVDDNLAGEGTETVVLTLAADVGYSVGSPNRATVSIADNDSIPAEIKVRQGTTVIADNSTTAVQFGTVAQGDAAKELIFNVQNMGGSPLTVGNIVLDNNIGFTVTQQPASPVAAGQSTTFKLRMSASSVGAKSANVRFTSNDLNESPFNFGVAGNVIPITCTLAPLGALSKQFESGSAGPGVISSGNGDPGGKSYGVWQFSLNKGTLAKFVNRFYSDYFSNLTLASSAFDAKWRQLAADDPTGFRNAQFEFAKAQFYDVFIKRLAATFGLDAEARSRAFQNVVWSTAIQHGAKNKVFDHALQPLLQGRTISDLTDEEIIVAVYHERARTDSSGTPVYFKNSSPSVQQAQLRRFRAESAKALKELSDEANC